MKIKKSFFLVLAIVSITISGVYAGGGGEDASAPIFIGVAGPHSGDLAPYGIPPLRASEIIAEQINSNGGINGREIKIIAADDVCDPAQATTVASKLVADGVVAVVGHVCSGATISAMATYMSAGIPIISPSATNPSLTKSGEYSGFYRTIAPDDMQGVSQAEFLYNKLGIKTIAVIHDQQDYGKGLADFTKGSYEALGGTVALYEGITVGAVDYSAVVSKILNQSVDAVVFGGYTPEGTKLISQLKEKNFTGVFISGDGMKGDDFLNLAGDASEGAYATSPKDYSSNDIYKKAIADHKSKFNEDPGVFYYEGHAGFTMIIEAIKAGNTTAADINTWLLSGQATATAVGTIAFDSNGDAQGTGFAVYQVQDGVYQAVK